jgi:hypothetical protein
MIPLVILGAMSTLLAATVSLSSAGTINTTRSNTFRLTYPTDLLSQAQANAILAELDKAGRTVGAGQVTEIIKRHGVQADRVKKIVVRPADKTRKHTTVLLLTNPADEAQAIAVSDSGTCCRKYDSKGNCIDAVSC